MGVLKDGSPLIIDGKIEIAADIVEVSQIVGSVLVGAVVQSTLAPLTEVQIAALVAMHLQRYSQTMV